MSSTAVFSALRRRKSPLAGAFFAPVGLSDGELVTALSLAATDLMTFDPVAGGIHRHRCRALIHKIKLLSSLFDALNESLVVSPPIPLPRSAVLCFKEFYIVLYRARALLEYCAQVSCVWALLWSPNIAALFHDINLEFATLLDVLPITDAGDAADIANLLRYQCHRSKLDVDPYQESLHHEILSFLSKFESGCRPDLNSLHDVFVNALGICNSESFVNEILFLEEQMYSQDDDADPSFLGGIVSLLRYSRFVLLDFEDNTYKLADSCEFSMKTLKKCGTGESSIAVPKDFCCAISLDLMRDPVILSTGQTYDRSSITHWMDEGHSTCPNSGLPLTHTQLVPNRALRNLISQWCAAYGIPYDPPDAVNSNEGVAAASASKAAIEANKATAEILVKQLTCSSVTGNAIAAMELRLLAKTGKENRSCIAEAGAIPHLRKLLDSPNPVAQENSVTALLNLSIHDQNKHLIMEEEGCLRSIVNVLINGWTEEARENAAAALFSLSAVHDYKKMILDESGAVEALAELLRRGSARGKKDAVTALFNLSTHSECSVRMLESGGVSAVIGALAEDGVAEDAAGALALLLRRPNVVEVVAKEDSAVLGLVGLMRMGTPRGKENGVAALQEMCRVGGPPLALKVVRTPGFGSLIQSILFTGTKRARRKAASLARMYRRCEIAAAPIGGGGLPLGYGLVRSGSMRRGSSYVSGDVSVSVSNLSMAISVPVL